MKSKARVSSLTTRVASAFPALAVCTFLSISLSACVFIHSSVIGQSTGSGSTVSAVDSDYGILRLSKPQGLTLSLIHI